MKTMFYIQNMFIIMSGLIITTVFIGMEHEAYSDNLRNSANTNNEYVIIGVVGVAKDIKPLHFMPIKRFELVSGDEHGGKTKLYPSIDIYQIIFEQYDLYMILDDKAQSITNSNVILFEKEYIIPSLIGPKDGKRQLFFAKRYFIPEGFSNNVPDSILLEIIRGKSFKIKEGTKEYENNLKKYDIKLPKDK